MNKDRKSNNERKLSKPCHMWVNVQNKQETTEAQAES